MIESLLSFRKLTIISNFLFYFLKKKSNSHTHIIPLEYFIKFMDSLG